MQRIFIIAVTVTLITACTDTAPQYDGVIDNHGDKINIAPIDYSFYEPVYIDSLMTDDLGKYIDYVAQTDYVAGISSSKNNPLRKEFIYTFSEASHVIGTKNGISEQPAFDVTINGMPIGESVNTKSAQGWESVYGTTVRFEISNSGLQTRTSPSTAMDMYIPELVNVTFPKMQEEADMYPLCYYDGFVVRWNADQNNTNGVLVAVEWFGAMVFGDHNPDAYIRRVDCVEDTGEAVLTKEMFDGIPDTAICHLTLLRGNLENVIADDYSFKLLGETHQNFPFVLLRNIRYKGR